MKKIIEKEAVKAPRKKRNLTQVELKEYVELVKLCNAQHWKANMIGGNTALVPNGQELFKTEEAIAKLLENAKNNWLSRILVECGIELGQAVKINSETGEISMDNNVVDNKK